MGRTPALAGFAPKLQANTRRGGLFRIELPPLVSDPDFWCKAALALKCTGWGVSSLAEKHLAQVGLAMPPLDGVPREAAILHEVVVGFEG